MLEKLGRMFSQSKCLKYRVKRKDVIKIGFCDFWPKFDVHKSFLMKILTTYYTVEISENPDFLFYSCFGSEHKNYTNCVKIFTTGENIIPNFNECDYGIGFDFISYGDRYYRRQPSSNIPKKKVDIKLAQRKFCNFIYSNASKGEGARLRQEFFEKISKYKHVDAPGKVCHNIDIDFEPREGDWSKGKLDLLQEYKFTIAFENSSSNGYTTEKIIHPLKSQSIPIYWGNPMVYKDFNTKAFINCTDYNNDFNAVIKKVIELDNDDDAYLKMLSTSPIKLSTRFKSIFNSLDVFLINIIEKGNAPYNKDSLIFQKKMCAKV